VKWIAKFVTMSVTMLIVTAFVTLMSISVLAQSTASSDRGRETLTHDREFWRAIAKNHFAVPEGQEIVPLLRELSGYLGSPDPELRDDLAYTITAVWIKHQAIPTDALDTFLDQWRANLLVGLSESGTQSVLKRSFSALSLAALAERDLKTPFLTDKQYRALLADALTYLKDERDLRGFDPALGWIHATAHTADLLAALAGNPLFKPEDQARLLQAIAERLASAHQIFAYGEQDRLALAAATAVLRKDFDQAGFNKWLTTIDTNDQRVWKDSPPRLELLQTFENDTYMLRGLAVYLGMGPTDPVVMDTQQLVLKVLRNR
jgi:uncharacterized protein DUF2785